MCMDEWGEGHHGAWYICPTLRDWHGGETELVRLNESFGVLGCSKTLNDGFA
jgi:hypothetical protein